MWNLQNFMPPLFFQLVPLGMSHAVLNHTNFPPKLGDLIKLSDMFKLFFLFVLQVLYKGEI